jgi:hypothetical protein
MQNDMNCPTCAKPETDCVCPECPMKGGVCGCRPGVCSCMHHKTLPILIILFGVSFLLQALSVLSAQANSIIWPILVILGGFFKLYGGACKCYMKHC